MRKNLDISNDAVRVLTILGAEKQPPMVFKHLAEKIIEDYAKPFIVLKKQVSVGKKKKK